MVAMAVAASAALVLGNAAIRANSPDPYSRLFAEKVLFCIHLDMFLASDVARQRLAALLGRDSDAFLALAATDIGSTSQTWPTLGFYGDACVFDRGLDRLIEAGNAGGREAPAAVYRRLFVATALDRPLSLAGKFARQIRYGLVMSWPPHGLGPNALSSSEDGYSGVAELMAQDHRPVERWMSRDSSVDPWLLSRHGGLQNYLFRAVSLLVCAIIIALPLCWIYRSRFDRTRLKQLSVISVIWLGSISTPALTHTLDVWRYIAPSTPIAALIIALGVALFRGLIPALPGSRPN
jgi:hypothetical protein